MLPAATVVRAIAAVTRVALRGSLASPAHTEPIADDTLAAARPIGMSGIVSPRPRARRRP